MSRNYKFHNPDGVYFVSFAVVKWLNIFAKENYKNALLDSLNYCQENKGMEIFAWCIMSNHVHLVFRSNGGSTPQNLLGDFKRFTSKLLVKMITENPNETHKEFLLTQFREAANNTSNVINFQFWQHDNQPIELWSNKVISEKIKYIHKNPVKANLVFKAEDYIYSSARDYAGKNGLLKVVIVDI